jgi:hypothetical protein
VNYLVRGNPNKVVAKIRAADGEMMHVRRRHLRETRVMPRGERDAPIALHLRFKNGHRLIEGPDALRVASLVVPHVNRYGAGKQTVADAVRSIEEAGSPVDYLARMGHVGALVTAAPVKRRWWTERRYDDTGLFGFSPIDRIALEMALHEDIERRAMEGELEMLERSWQEAETEAAIADSLTDTPELTQKLAQLHQP